MNLGNYYKGAPPPPIKKKSKILIFAKKCLLFCIFRIIDFIFWIKKPLSKLFEYSLRTALTIYLCFFVIIYLITGLRYEKIFKHFDKLLKTKFIEKWLKK